ncbi:MAG: type II secretion system protein GspG [Phycisphaeraceae bacterium]|nr:type II secretion system protein GspG [Phycisphaeraceae bacterium]
MKSMKNLMHPNLPVSRHSRRLKRRALRRRAFTLLEIIIAVTIVAILAALIVPRLTGFIGQAKNDRAKADAATLAQQVELYMTKNHLSTVPSDFSLEVLAEGEPPMLRNRKQLLDPWGRPFTIRVPGVVNYDFDIVSAGEDGELGTPDDIVNGQT